MRDLRYSRPSGLIAIAMAFLLPCIPRLDAIEIDFDAEPDPEILSVTNIGGPPAEWRGSGGVDDSGYLSLTDNVNNTRNTVIINREAQELTVEGFDFSIDLRVGGGTERPADGFSVNLVRPGDPLLQDPIGQGFAGTLDIGGVEFNLPEEGSETGLGIGLDSWASGGEDVIGVSVRVDGELIHQIQADTPNGTPGDSSSLQTGPRNEADPGSPTAFLTWQPLRVQLDPVTSELSVAWKGETLLDKTPIAWTPSPLHLVLGARTGGANQHVHVDNLNFQQLGHADFPVFQVNAFAPFTGLLILPGGSPDDRFDPASLTVTVNEDPVAITPFSEDGQTVYRVDFVPGLHQAWVITASTFGGRTLRSEGTFGPPLLPIFEGGLFTTRHVWAEDFEIRSIDAAEEALSGGVPLKGDVTVRYPYIHFHDNAGLAAIFQSLDSLSPLVRTASHRAGSNPGRRAPWWRFRRPKRFRHRVHRAHLRQGIRQTSFCGQ